MTVYPNLLNLINIEKNPDCTVFIFFQRGCMCWRWIIMTSNLNFEDVQ